MRDKYYTATEAALALGLEYHTFMARVRKGDYTFEEWGRSKVFARDYIDAKAKSQANASDTFDLA